MMLRLHHAIDMYKGAEHSAARVAQEIRSSVMLGIERHVTDGAVDHAWTDKVFGGTGAYEAERRLGHDPPGFADVTSRIDQKLLTLYGSFILELYVHYRCVKYWREKGVRTTNL